MSSALAGEFARYTTGMISDALDELGIHGVINGLEARLDRPVRVAGLALPVRFERKERDPAAYRFGGGVGRPLEQVLKTMKAGEVVVFDLGGSGSASPWGGLASRLARQRGVVGTVVWGCCRDVEETRQIGYPVWSVGTCPRRSRNEFSFGSIGEPISVAGVTVRAGDVIVGDLTGVVCVPRDLADEVLSLVRRIAGTEAELERQINERSVVNWDQV